VLVRFAPRWLAEVLMALPTKAVILVLLGVAVLFAVATSRQRRAAEPDLLGLAAAGGHSDPVPAGYGPSTPGIPRLVAIGAGECIPCKAMAPIRAELRRDYQGVLAVDFYDVWKNPAAGRHFGTRIPTLIFYDASGRELARREGYVGRAEILATWAQWGVTLRRTAG
jgi:thioredoxin 1